MACLNAVERPLDIYLNVVHGKTASPVQTSLKNDCLRGKTCPHVSCLDLKLNVRSLWWSFSRYGASWN
jgi:hypothetical protein